MADDTQDTDDTQDIRPEKAEALQVAAMGTQEELIRQMRAHGLNSPETIWAGLAMTMGLAIAFSHNDARQGLTWMREQLDDAIDRISRGESQLPSLFERAKRERDKRPRYDA